MEPAIVWIALFMLNGSLIKTDHPPYFKSFDECMINASIMGSSITIPMEHLKQMNPDLPDMKLKFTCRRAYLT